MSLVKLIIFKMEALQLRLPRKRKYSDESTLASDSPRRVVHRRKRKSKDQITYLSNEFLKSRDWDSAKVKELAKLTGLSTSQVYKWNWDQKKLISISSFLCEETLMPSKCDVEIFKLTFEYRNALNEVLINETTDLFFKLDKTPKNC